jgi:type IV fimbrial biogenesis protein FimT
MIGIAIMAILLGLAVPSFQTWFQNIQIRNAAESITNGLQRARAEAVARNTTAVRFQLTNNLSNSCALSIVNTNWVVSQDNPANACDSAASDTVAPRLIQTRAASEGSLNAVAASATLKADGTAATAVFDGSITFDGLGRVTAPAGDAAMVTIDVSNPTGGSCATAAGPMRCLRIEISVPGGQARMCDPAKPATSPQGC